MTRIATIFINARVNKFTLEFADNGITKYHTKKVTMEMQMTTSTNTSDTLSANF